MTLAAVCSFEEFLASPEINEVNIGEWSEGGLNLYRFGEKFFAHLLVVLVFGPVGYTLPRCCFQEVKIEHTCFKRLAKVHVQIFDLIPLHPTVHCTSVLEQLLQSMLEVLWLAGMAGVNLKHQNCNTFFTRVAGTKIYRWRASKQRRFPVSRLRPGTSVSRIWGGKNAFLRKWP